jgi:IclR family pca regulon transcriptional regulator
MSSNLVTPDSETYVEAFARGLTVICAFDASHPELTLSEVAEITGISRAAARRLLSTLVHLGYVHASGRTFSLTAKIMRLGYAYLSGQALPDIVEPYVVKVADQTGESCSVCVLDDTEVVYIARASVKKIMSINLSIGTRLPAWATATGRVLLSSLAQPELARVLANSQITEHAVNTLTSVAALEANIATVHEHGYSLVSQELEFGLTAVAVPLRDKSGRVIAAMNVAGHVLRNTREQMLEHHLPILQNAAAEINAALASR